MSPASACISATTAVSSTRCCACATSATPSSSSSTTKRRCARPTTSSTWGPGAGEHGGSVVSEGTPQQVMDDPDSLTGEYPVAARKRIALPGQRRLPLKRFTVRGARSTTCEDIDVGFPLGACICVTGVSGSGKSTLVNEILYPGTGQPSHAAPSARWRPRRHRRRASQLDKVIDIDQSPIGRTPRSNPATYTGRLRPHPQLFRRPAKRRSAATSPGRFSFNVKGGRCEACKGRRPIKIEMHFLPDVYVTCEVCQRQALQPRDARGHVQGQEHRRGARDDASRSSVEFFANIPHDRAASSRP